MKVIALPETVTVRGILTDSGVYWAERGKVLVTSSLNKDTMLKKSTQLELFQVCKHPIEIINDIQEESQDTKSVCSAMENLDLGRKSRNHLKSISRPDLEQDLISYY